MAILNKIRQRSLILILVIALALFAFVIQGVIDNPQSFTGSQDVVATVNGEDINRLEFQQKVKNYQDRSGGSQTETQSKNLIYNQELRRIVMSSEFETLGLSVESDEMSALFKNSFSSYPEFQDENENFDLERLYAFIANLKEISPAPATLTYNGQLINVTYESWTTNEGNIANSAIQQSYFNMIKAGVGATISEAKADYLGDAKTLNMRFVQIPYATIADSLVDVSKSDIKSYMQAHKEQFESDPTRQLVYVEFKEDPSKADEDAIKTSLLNLKTNSVVYNPNSKINDTIQGFNTTTDIAEFVNSNSDIKYNDTFLRKGQFPVAIQDSLFKTNVGGYYGPYKEGGYYKLSKVVATKSLPDSVRVRHILIPYVGSERAAPTVTKTPEQAKVTADSILTVLKGDRSKFLSLLDLSSDLASNEKKGVIDFAYNSAFAPQFKAFSFDNKKGDMDVVATSFGYHIIEILGQTNYSNTLKVATVANRIEASDETLQDVFNNVSNFEIAAKGKDFNDLAKEKELTLKPITFKELDENMPGLGSQRKIVRWAFNEDTNVDDFKRFEVSGFGFVVAKLVEKNDEDMMSVEDGSVTALKEIQNERKAKLIREKIKATSLDEIAKNQGQSALTASAISLKNTTLTGAGVEPKVIGAAFGMAEGETSKPIDGNKGIFIVEITKVNEETKLDNFTSIINRLTSARRNSAQSKVIQALEKAADVDDNRANTVY